MAPSSGKPPAPRVTTNASGFFSCPDTSASAASFSSRDVEPVRDFSSHSLLTAALKSRVAGGVGSPSDNRPPDGLAERVAGDPTATRKPLCSLTGEGGLA